jgi:hypothetical protein
VNLSEWKPSADVTKSIVFCVVLLCVTILVYAGKIPEDYLRYLFVWLVPSPIEPPKSKTP